MRAILHTEFAALLARAGVTQAAFARLTGVTPRQVNNWTRGRAKVPRWAAVLGVVLLQHTLDALELDASETSHRWDEVLGVAPMADADTIQQAAAELRDRHDPNAGDHSKLMARVNAAHEEALHALAAQNAEPR